MLYFRSTALLLLLLGACGPQTPPREGDPAPSTTHDLGPVRLQLPAGWQAQDYDRSGLETPDKGPRYRRYLFVNTASRDTALREMVVLNIDQREGPRNVRQAARELTASLRAFPNQQRLLQLRDTLLCNGQLAVVEATCRNAALRVDLVQTYAFYAHGPVLVGFLGTARSQPGAADPQNRRLFRRAIESITWQ